MNELEIFKFENNEVRTKVINNEPYFALTDVCKILEIANVGNVATRLHKEGIRSMDISEISGFGGIRTYKINFINESNLYKCIFQSRKAEAEKFQDWITTEVLPKIRKYGMYATDELINNPDLLIQVASKLKEEKEARRIAEEQAEQRRLFEVKETSITHGNGIITTHFTSKVTGKGQIYFINKIKKEFEKIGE